MARDEFGDEPQRSDSPVAGCGCLGAFLGCALVMAVVGEYMNRPGAFNPDSEGLSGPWDGFWFGAPVGAIIGVILGYALDVPFQRARRRVDSSVLWVIVLVGSFAAACVLEVMMSKIAISLAPPTPKPPVYAPLPSSPRNPGMGMYLSPNSPGVGTTPLGPSGTSGTTRPRRKEVHPLNPALNPEDL